jgi:hypothetical protein
VKKMKYESGEENRESIIRRMAWRNGENENMK